MVNALRKAHHSHRSLARTVRAALRLRKPPTPGAETLRCPCGSFPFPMEPTYDTHTLTSCCVRALAAISAPPSPTLPPAITPTARLSVTPTAHPTASVSSPHAPFTSILPRPQLFRWGAMAIAPLDEPLVDLVPLPLSRHQVRSRHSIPFCSPLQNPTHRALCVGFCHAWVCTNGLPPDCPFRCCGWGLHHQQPPPARERPAYLDKPSPELVRVLPLHAQHLHIVACLLSTLTTTSIRTLKTHADDASLVFSPYAGAHAAAQA
jgi:hypothetical protein